MRFRVLDSNPNLYLLFFIRENRQCGKHKKNDNYSKKNITIDINQDPINQLVYLMFKPVKIFKSSGSFIASKLSYQPIFLQLQNRASTASITIYIQKVFNQNLHWTHLMVFIYELRRWSERKGYLSN